MEVLEAFKVTVLPLTPPDKSQFGPAVLQGAVTPAGQVLMFDTNSEVMEVPLVELTITL